MTICAINFSGRSAAAEKLSDVTGFEVCSPPTWRSHSRFARRPVIFPLTVMGLIWPRGETRFTCSRKARASGLDGASPLDKSIAVTAAFVTSGNNDRWRVFRDVRNTESTSGSRTRSPNDARARVFTRKASAASWRAKSAVSWSNACVSIPSTVEPNRDASFTLANVHAR